MSTYLRKESVRGASGVEHSLLMYGDSIIDFADPAVNESGEVYVLRVFVAMMDTKIKKAVIVGRNFSKVAYSIAKSYEEKGYKIKLVPTENLFLDIPQ